MKNGENTMDLNRIKIISVKGRPMVQFIFNKPIYSWSFYRGMGADRRIKHVEDNILQMPVSFMMDFFKCNKNIVGEWVNTPVDKESVKYYCYNDTSGIDHFSTKLTPKYIENWANYDYPTLTAYIPNTDNSTNCLGMYIPEFSHVLYESNWSDTKIGELTEEEYLSIVSALSKNSSVRDRIEEAWINQQSNADVDEILKRVEKYERLINDEIEKYAKELIEYKETLSKVPFDCGFGFVRTHNELINKDIRFLISKGIRNTEDLNVEFPTDYFSVSNTRRIFNKLKEISKSSIIEELYLITKLD